MNIFDCLSDQSTYKMFWKQRWEKLFQKKLSNVYISDHNPINFYVQ